MVTREEHIAWCKKVALLILNGQGTPVEAMTSMMSDLEKHPETKPGPAIGSMFVGFCMIGDYDTAKKFIEGFR
jgi:hypothetical protein